MCDQELSEQLLTRYMRGELDDANMQDVEAHLLSCDDCQARAEEIKRRVFLERLVGDHAALAEGIVAEKHQGNLSFGVRGATKAISDAADRLHDRLSRLLAGFQMNAVTPAIATVRDSSVSLIRRAVDLVENGFTLELRRESDEASFAIRLDDECSNLYMSLKPRTGVIHFSLNIISASTGELISRVDLDPDSGAYVLPVNLLDKDIILEWKDNS